MRSELDSQIVAALVRALEPTVVQAVERAVKQAMEQSLLVVRSNTAPESIGRLLSVKDVSRHLSISRSKVWEMVSRGELRSLKLGRCRRFKEEDVAALART